MVLFRSLPIPCFGWKFGTPSLLLECVVIDSCIVSNIKHVLVLLNVGGNKHHGEFLRYFGGTVVHLGVIAFYCGTPGRHKTGESGYCTLRSHEGASGDHGGQGALGDRRI